MGIFEMIRRWWIGREIRSGKRPRGRTGHLTVMGGAEISPQAGTLHTILTARHFDRNGNEITGDRREIHNKKFTTTARDAIAAAFNANAGYTLSNFNYHDAGTGTTAEANTQTALVTPWGGARVSGTQTNPSTNIYQSVATITFNDAFAITEHGVFSASSAGDLLDRTVFAAINVGDGDSIQFTFQLTFAAEA